MISDVKNLSFFDNSLRTRVVADASPVALGAVLLQFESSTDDSPKFICYASKSLTSTEQRYCQTEKESLALVWAVERFAHYLIGRTFELETDHKPLEAIFSPTSRPCLRIERWILRLQSFRFRVVYRKGSSNIADSLSRLTVHSNDNEDIDPDEKFLILTVLESTAIDISEIEDATIHDQELTLVKDSLRSGIWKYPEIKVYETFQNELGLVGELVVRGNKMIVPSSLRRRFLELGHEGHPGESGMKRRLRDRVWWPGMDKVIKKWITDCEGCRLTGLPQKPEAMQRRPLPLEAWVDVAIDFLGPLPSGEYLFVIVDYFSRYKEVEIMTKITAKDTVDRLRAIFKRLGFPRTISLDNAKQFLSSEFRDYCRGCGITLNYTTPYFPQQNGEVERQNRSLLKRLQISNALKRDWKQDLDEYLTMYYSTPHSITGKTPSELMLGRTIRTKLPFLREIETAPPNDEFCDRDAIAKKHACDRENIKRNARPSSIQEGDKVLMQNLLPGNKLTTTYSPVEYTVVRKSGTRCTVQSEDSGTTYERNSSHLKKIPTSVPAESVDLTSTRSSTSPSNCSISQEPLREDSPPAPLDTSPKPADIPNIPSRPKRVCKRPLKFDDYVDVPLDQ